MISAVDLKRKMLRIDEDLHTELHNIGKYGDYMGDIIRKLLMHYKKTAKK